MSVLYYKIDGLEFKFKVDTLSYLPHDSRPKVVLERIELLDTQVQQAKKLLVDIDLLEVAKGIIKPQNLLVAVKTHEVGVALSVNYLLRVDNGYRAVSQEMLVHKKREQAGIVNNFRARINARLIGAQKTLVELGEKQLSLESLIRDEQ